MRIDDIYINYLYYVTSFFFAVSIISNLSQWLFLWQDRDYRIKRVFVQILETKEGLSIVLGWESLLKVAAIIFFFFTVLDDELLTIFPLVVSGVYFLSFVKQLWRIKNNTTRTPYLDMGIAVIFSVSVVTVGLIYLFPLLNKFFWLLFIDKITTIVMWLLIFFVSIITDFTKDVRINNAIKKRLGHKDLIAIGITGSYGKGEVKEYTAQMLAQKYNVLKTPNKTYTPEQVARFVNRELSDKKQVFIADMNTYRLGDITSVAAVVKPTIGILTALDDQHYSLLGSEKNIIKAHSELLDALPRKSMTLIQSDTVLLRKMKRVGHGTKITYSTTDKNASVFASDIKVFPNRVVFTVHINGKRFGKFTAHTVGGQVVSSLLPAIYISEYLGVDTKYIRDVLQKIQPLPHIMQPYKTTSGALIIDDTYHTNMASVNSALEYMKLYKGKRYMVYQPMTELGKQTAQRNFEAAKKIAQVCDGLFVTNKNSYSAIKKAVQASTHHCELYNTPPRVVAEYLQGNLKKQDIVTCEGHEGYPIIQQIGKELVIT